jgi:hypothetical protein
MTMKLGNGLRSRIEPEARSGAHRSIPGQRRLRHLFAQSEDMLLPERGSLKCPSSWNRFLDLQLCLHRHAQPHP